MLYYTIQRYKFESNSQHDSDLRQACEVVLHDTKIQIWKQFTTTMPLFSRRDRLYYTIQRYKFESNSQPTSTVSTLIVSCITRYKDTNLKASHNWPGSGALQPVVVLHDTKIQIWKQFTTAVVLFNLPGQLYYTIQRYKFESNSQLRLKSVLQRIVVLHDTKIQIWKQFTTRMNANVLQVMLYYTIQRYKFESNSQQLRPVLLYMRCCITRYKDTNLKAIHNTLVGMTRWKVVVLHDTKIQIWKQFTTIPTLTTRLSTLYYTIQRYKFESNSQQGTSHSR